MNIGTKKKLRDSLKLTGAIIFSFLYIPHLIIANFINKDSIMSDIDKFRSIINIKLPRSLALLYLLHNDSYYRSLFYFRIKPFVALLIGWWRPGNKYFIFSKNMVIGKGVYMSHPYATIINAEQIGDNFNVRHLTTIGDIDGKRPVIGNNVTLAPNVTIIGGVVIGDNVIVGAGSVVVKDVPDNCIVAGNPAKLIRKLDPE